MNMNAALVSPSSVRSGTLLKGLWGLEHRRPINDHELRKQVRRNEMEAFLAKCGLPRLSGKIRRGLERIGPAVSEVIGVDNWGNIVVNVGLDLLLDTTLSGGTPITSWFIGLKDTGTPVVADTMASHVSWVTISPYSNGTDPAWVDGGVSGQSVDNVASTADFSIDATDEIFGAFLKDNSTVDVATGSLYAVGDFPASRNVINGDTLKVTATFTAADDAV